MGHTFTYVSFAFRSSTLKNFDIVWIPYPKDEARETLSLTVKLSMVMSFKQASTHVLCSCFRGMFHGRYGLLSCYIFNFKYI